MKLRVYSNTKMSKEVNLFYDDDFEMVEGTEDITIKEETVLPMYQVIQEMMNKKLIYSMNW